MYSGVLSSSLNLSKQGHKWCDIVQAHKAPTPQPIEEPLPGEHPVPQEDPVPSPNPELDNSKS